MDFTIEGLVAKLDPLRARLDMIAELASKPPVVSASSTAAPIASAGSSTKITTGVWSISGDIAASLIGRLTHPEFNSLVLNQHRSLSFA